MNNNNKNFPFALVKKTDLAPVEKYYMMLSTGAKGQVSKVEGVYIRTETTPEKRDYAVFKQISILNKTYKQCQCRSMLVRHPEGILALDGCNSYSDKAKNRVINKEREVYLDVNHWKFGLPTKHRIATNKVLDKLPPDMGHEINTFLGTVKPFLKMKTAKGGKNRRRNRNSRKRHSCSRKK